MKHARMCDGGRRVMEKGEGLYQMQDPVRLLDKHEHWAKLYR